MGIALITWQYSHFHSINSANPRTCNVFLPSSILYDFPFYSGLNFSLWKPFTSWVRYVHKYLILESYSVWNSYSNFFLWKYAAGINEGQFFNIDFVSCIFLLFSVSFKHHFPKKWETWIVLFYWVVFYLDISIIL